jgi:Domain of unknown function (DUF4424)
MRLMAAFAFALLACSPAFGNDGFSQIGVGGLVLADTNDISMDKEDLYVSAQEIRVDYVMTNATAKDIEASVMFPLPDLVLEDEFNTARGMVDYAGDMKFETKVDGKPFPIELVQKAFVGDKDVTDVLLKAGIPVTGVMEGLEDHVRQLRPEVLQSLFAVGALEKLTNESGKEIPFPPDMMIPMQWTVKTYVTRKQLFPAGRSLIVSHRYRPLIGEAVEGSIDYTTEGLAEYDAEGLANVKSEQAKYCVDGDWLKTYRARVKKEGGRKGSPQWISYILSSGATWKGPIKDFRLVVDKGKADSLVSFCGDGVKKISPTQFEVRKKDFEPKDDLHVLLVNWQALE